MYQAALYVNRDFYVGDIVADSIRALKAKASKRANDFYMSLDRLVVFRAGGKDVDPYEFTRRNKRDQYGEMDRGAWS